MQFSNWLALSASVACMWAAVGCGDEAVVQANPAAETSANANASDVAAPDAGAADAAGAGADSSSDSASTDIVLVPDGLPVFDAADVPTSDVPPDAALADVDDAGADAATDGGAEETADAAPELAADAQPDALVDDVADAQADASMDTAADAAQDDAEVAATLDTATDTAPDADSPPDAAQVDVAADVDAETGDPEVGADAAQEDSAADSVQVDAQAPDAADAGPDSAPDAQPDMAPPQCGVASDCAGLGVAAPCSSWACSSGNCQQIKDKDGTACEDGSACTQADTCKAGGCAPGPAKVCNDANACTTDICVPTSGACASSASAGFCDDLNPCTEPDSCKDGACAAGSAKNCADANPCTSDQCDSSSGVCVNAAVTATCDDASKCTTADSCTGGKCVGKPIAPCDDANACTDDVCDSGTGCVSISNTAACANAAQCVLGTCQNGACQPGATQGCDDNNVCTKDTCDGTKGCVYVAVSDGTACGGGGNLCMEAPKCGKGLCAVPVKVSCDDGNPCTDDVCDPAVGCKWIANKAGCDDGDKCTTADTCGSGKCAAGKPADPKAFCDDSNSCSDDTCDKLKGCLHAAKAGTCDDGNPCTVGEACGNAVCSGGKPATCDDGKQCTIDNCDSKTGDCSWVAKAGACDDGNACTAGDLCQAAACLPGAVTVCDDKEPCTANSCDPKTGCVYTPTAGASVPACDGVVANGACFKALAVNLSWTQAQAGCVAWGGHLARISSAAENTSVRSIANTVCGAASTLWIGATDQFTEGAFVWTDGTPLTYTNWAGGEPNNCVGCCSIANAGEDGSQMLASGQWNDVCVATAAACHVCRRPIPSVACSDPTKCMAGGVCASSKCAGGSTSCDDGNSCTADSCDASGKGCVHSLVDEGAKCGVGVCGGGHCTPGVDLSWPATSCAAIPKAPTPTDSLYWIDPDGAGPTVSVQTGCTWAVGGGGWAMVAIVANDAQNTWTWNARTLWTTDKTTFGLPTTPTKDFKSPLFHSLPFKDVLFFHQPSGQWAQYNTVGDGKQTFAQKIASVGATPVCYTAAQGFPMTAGTIKAGGALCNTNLYISPNDHDGNAACGDDDQTFGPAWNTLTNATVCFFDDPGITGGLGPLASSGAAEQANLGFGQVLSLNTGTASSGQNRMIVLVR